MSNQSYLGINIDLSRDRELSEQAQQLLTNYYCLQNEPSPQYAFARAAVAYSFGDMNLAQRIYDAAAKGWFMFASPVLSNAPLPGVKVKSLPISCFLSYVPDSLEGLIEHSSELRWLSVKGGGVGGHWSSVRAVSDKAPGLSHLCIQLMLIWLPIDKVKLVKVHMLHIWTYHTLI